MFHGFFNLHGLLIIALEDCGEPVTQEMYPSLKEKIDAAVSRIRECNVDHNDLECRDGEYPNILQRDGDIRIIDFHVSRFIEEIIIPEEQTRTYLPRSAKNKTK